MSAHRIQRCAVGRAVLVLAWMSWALVNRGTGQQLLPAAPEQPPSQINALADRLALQLLAAKKKHPLIADLTLPNDASSALGAWLADQISSHLAQDYPELEVISRYRWDSLPASEFSDDRNQTFAQREQQARELGAEILVQGNFAAVPGGIGITLLAGERLVGGIDRFEALAELPLTSEMNAMLTTRLPERVVTGGAYRASIAGIGSPLCQDCPPPAYTYVARAKKLSGVVIAELRVSREGLAEEVKIVRAPHGALASAALHTVRNWRFKPARDFREQFVPVFVNVAVLFRLDALQPARTPVITKNAN